jgi:hypothetical protein
VSAQSLMRWSAVLLALTLFCPLVFGQPNRPGQPGRPFPQPGQPNRPGQPGPTGSNTVDAARQAGALSCAACSGIFTLIIAGIVLIIHTIIWVLVAIWVANDAKARGMDNSALWVVLTIFLGLIGLIIYLVSRPTGELTICRECGKKRLREARRCPHCRAA